ncbi:MULTISPECIES: hypothetical protein [Streptomyces]|uniref:Uncharacterized protein n=1 Tax=Streptomyces eurythermus TaxID=42237 RepID=A0ABW6Z3I6_9ACTN|nr:MULTISPECIES: hypothetical protein [Streptomyces]QIS75179.1 hypothetical protein HB370_38840 [Streptomyces sp. DSM 40868]
MHSGDITTVQVHVTQGAGHGDDPTEKVNEAIIAFLQSGWEFAEAAHLQWESSLLVPRWDRERLAQLGRVVEQDGTRVRVLCPDLINWVDSMNKGLRMVDQGIEEWSNPEIDKPSFFPAVAMPHLVRTLNGLEDHLADMGSERATDS